MAITVKIKLSSSTAGNTVVFAETSTGHFTTAISSTSAVSVTSSDKPLRAAAISTRAGYYISSWNGPTDQDENLASWTRTSSSEDYPRYSYTTANGPSVTVVDEHGTHLGTPTGTGYYKSGNCVGVMHSTTASGWTFTGWTVTLATSSEGSSYGTMLSYGGSKSGSVYTFGATREAIVFQLGSSSAYKVTFTANYVSSGGGTEDGLALPFRLAENAVGKLVLFVGGCYSSGSTYRVSLKEYITDTESKVVSASRAECNYLEVHAAQIAPLENVVQIWFNSGKAYRYNTYGAWAMFSGNDPDGTPILCEVYTKAFDTSKVKVTVLDEHGQHVGTQNCTETEFYAHSTIAVMHTSSDAGWAFLGWRFKGETPNSGPAPLAQYWTKISDTEWFLPASVHAAVCHTVSSVAITLVAEYEKSATASVAWMVDGCMVASTECTENDYYVLPDANPGKSGYTFLGWFTEKSGGTQVTSETKYLADSATTLYAQWSKDGGSGDDTHTGLMVRSASSDFLVFSASGGFLVYDA